MPIGQQPTQPTSNAVQVENTQSLKVYYKIDIEKGWTRDYALVCLGHDKTKGSKIGSAQFTLLYNNNDSTNTHWKTADLSMRFNAAKKYRCDMSDGYQTPYLVKVTDVIDGEETAVWYGYISTVEQDFVRERASLTALTYEGLLDQQQISGGWFVNIKNLTDYYYRFVPVYNPDGIGNKSTITLSPSPAKYPVLGVDDTLLKKTKEDANKWTAGDMINQVWGRCAGQLFKSGTQGNPYGWAKDLYRDGLSLDNTKVAEILSSSYAMDNYSLQGKTIWEALVELVESVDGLTISQEIDYPNVLEGSTNKTDFKNGKPYLVIVNLKG
jgi:hypothetical protein